MSTFPLDRTALQQAATIYLDPDLRSLADVRIAGVPQPGSVITAGSDGLWPLFTVEGSSAVYFRSDVGTVVSMAAAIGSPSPIVLTQSTEDNPALTELIDALIQLGLPLVNATAAKPIVVVVDPDAGSSAGGEPVSIYGFGFLSATGVTFDGDAGTALNIEGDSKLTITTPAHAGGSGTVDVVVESSDGNSDPAEFTYTDPAAVLDSIDPGAGPEAGGTPVTVTGEWFADATAVTFGGTPGDNFTVVSDTEITVDSPAGTGVVPVVVESPNGDSIEVVTFEYEA